MDNVLPTKGIGVVDLRLIRLLRFTNLTDLCKKPKFYHIDPSWAAIDLIPVISTPTYGDIITPAIVKQLEIQSQKDSRQFAKAKAIAYKDFCNGTMLVGEFRSESVRDGKPMVREATIKAGLAFAYAEPEGLLSRGIRMSVWLL